MAARLIQARPVQQDAFAEAAATALAPQQPPQAAHARRGSSHPQLVAPAGHAHEVRELWLAVHLPQLEGEVPAHLPGEAHRRRRLLERLAGAAYNFSPRVSLAPPDGLLLEIKGSLKLFAGAENICRQLSAAHRALNTETVLAIAPTPLAALARARARHEPQITDAAHLVGSVSSLPLNSLRWPEGVIARLAKIGVYNVGQALRLPRAGFARRFGSAQLASLDRLTGRSADLPQRFQPRERFRRRREFTYEIENHSTLLHIVEPLLKELEDFLRVRQAGITHLECRLRHRRAPLTRCIVKLAAPAGEAHHLYRLLNEHLARTVLPEPVRSCELRTGVAAPLTHLSDNLWQSGEHGGAGSAQSAQLLEYLRARLSAQAVHGLTVISDPWPEGASRATEPNLAAATPVALAGQGEQPLESPRPLWLLASPKPLRVRAGRPWYRGTLEIRRPVGDFQLLPSERIESERGARDYYVARDVRGVLLWIFREQNLPHGWFMHGVFG